MIPNSTLFTWTIEAAEKVTGVDADCLTSGMRPPKVSEARTAVFYVLHCYGWPAQRIAGFFKGVNGKTISVSTVTHAIIRARRMIGYDSKFRDLYSGIKDEVKAQKESVRTVSIGLRYTR
jgi:hypothetical protein